MRSDQTLMLSVKMYLKQQIKGTASCRTICMDWVEEFGENDTSTTRNNIACVNHVLDIGEYYSDYA